MQSYLQYQKSQTSTPSPPRSRTNSKPSALSESPFQSRDNSREGILHNETPPLVDWEDENDPDHPRNWRLSLKIRICVIVFFNVFVLDWCSSADSRTNDKIRADFGVSNTVESLSTACYVWGIALGALAAGPISETVGRNPIYTLSRLFHLCFILGSALAPNLATQLVCRFLAGLGASIISAIHGASVADVFDANGRSWAWPWVALSSFLGTSFSPVVSGWISQGSHISWRWADWISFFMSCAIFIVTFFWLPETFSPILLKWRAKRIRKLTGDDSYLAPIEVQTSFKKRLAHNFRRAFLMTTKEYIVILLGLWLVVVYVVEYGFLEGFNYLFRRTYGLNHGLTGTVFCTIAVGIVLSTLLSTYYALQHKKRAEQWHRNTGGREALPPENRLLPAMLVSLTFPISIFWLGWTNYPSISIWSGLGAATLFGFSWAGIYVAIYSYILDVYGIYAGSALATITCARYGFAGGMSVAAGPLYSNLGTHWACTLLGCIATLLVPIPFVFYKWGPKIRQISRFAGKKELADGAENSPDEENEPV